MFEKKLNFRNSKKFLHTESVSVVKHDIIFLCDARKNTKYVIDNIFAGHCLKQRLFSIGIIPGEEITVLDISAWGPVTIIAKGIKIALGRGAAGKITLKRISESRDKK